MSCTPGTIDKLTDVVAMYIYSFGVSFTFTARLTSQ